ncbi:nuclear transport factor 2 family protein [Shewanella glacialipiscicola]|uniref:Transcriptional regulator n=1 Tax=Shewanella glacialipiscicola TaxID=614069 RepID=A0ABQ6J173_9GAMM|nr:nuclear transport factor 2 family protein [Shewanella glacialipiscicola]MCL1086556.1 nuclear transport factor 2 family protein [Shewanella glacialipiscicola]GIU05418.1 transcriptional regulator [Shewanella glacialipiscicola]GMA81241.1 transcriptional regulator [Shewanella glacialipiscicola]
MINSAVIKPNPLVDNFIELYQALNKNNLHLLGQVYGDDIIFTDPMHQISGLESLTQYFAKLYENVQHIQFEIKEVQQSDGQASLFWQMQYRHPKLNKGQLIRVDGMSQLKFNDKIYFHRDYFDLGQMLYEQVPFVGGLIRLLKTRAAK